MNWESVLIQAVEAVAPAFEQADPNRMSKQQGLQAV